MLSIVILVSSINIGAAQKEDDSMKVEKSILKLGNYSAIGLSNSSHPVFEITKWFERTGNNFAQLKNAIGWAVCCKGIVKAPVHFLFPSSRIADFSLFTYSLPKTFTSPRCSTGLSHEFFYIEKPEKCTYDRKRVENYVIFDNIYKRGVPQRHFPCKTNCGAEGENVLTVFFRSGDIFENASPPFTYYRQPPLYFYETIINSRNWRKVVFVSGTSKFMNPVWKYYFENDDQRYVDMVFESMTSLNDTVSVLINAVNLVSAHSTLTTMIESVTTMAKTIFCAKCRTTASPFQNIPLPNYYEKELNTTEEFVDWMLTYKPY